MITKGSKLGLHALRNGKVLSYVRRAAQQVTPFAVVKGVDNAGIALDVKAASPSTITITRFVNAVEDGAQNVLNWNLIEMEQHADAVLGGVVRRLSRDELRAADFLEPINEADPEGGAAGWLKFGQYCAVLCRLADRLGVHIALPAFNAGTPEYNEMEAFADSGVMQAMQQGKHILTTHEGVFNAEPIIAGGLIPGAPNVAGAGDMICRYRYLYDYLERRALPLPPLVISEFYGGYVNQGYAAASQFEHYLRIAAYDAEVRRDAYVLAFLPFTIDPIEGWQRQDYGPVFEAENIWSYMRAERDQPNATNPHAAKVYGKLSLFYMPDAATLYNWTRLQER